MTTPYTIALSLAAFIAGLVFSYNPKAPSLPNWWIPIMFLSGFWIGRFWERQKE